jgi:RloB-like protein
MPRIRRGTIRRSYGQVKDPRTFFFIASEGTETEVAYFDMINQYVKSQPQLNLKVAVEILERTETASSPRHVIKVLDQKIKEYVIKEGDELWLLIDRDRWKLETLAEVARLCRQKNYEFCLSTPCFELWLLLHLADLDNYTDDEKAKLLANQRDDIVKSRTRLEKELSDLLQQQGGYQKNTIRSDVFFPLVETAVTAAKKHQLDNDEWATDAFYSRVSVLVGRILKI